MTSSEIESRSVPNGMGLDIRGDQPVDLQRFCYSEMGTFGEMLIGGVTLYTVERPWLNNQVNVSCIPEGVYQCIPRHYNRGGYDAVEVCDVPNRTHILAHVANTIRDVAGCIGIGFGLGFHDSLKLWMVTDSQKAFDFFMGEVGHSPFTLRIDHFRID